MDHAALNEAYRLLKVYQRRAAQSGVKKDPDFEERMKKLRFLSVKNADSCQKEKRATAELNLVDACIREAEQTAMRLALARWAPLTSGAEEEGFVSGFLVPHELRQDFFKIMMYMWRHPAG